MEDKLVTLAIRTYQRAQMIKAILEENSIETVIHNLNLENPEMAVGVRVRIKEKDLPRALKIVEEVENAWEKEEKPDNEKEVLIPVDFADIAPNAIEIGFHYAHELKAKVVLMYAYFRPAYTISSNNHDMNIYSLSDAELLRRVVSQANADKENMSNLIRKQINRNELPDVQHRFELREGVPEDEILEYCKRHKPALVVMGSQGKKLSTEIVGSVSGEVLESCVSPVLAVPASSGIKKLQDIRRVAFLTNFEQKDLIAIDNAISLFLSKKLEVFFIHASEKNEKWDEIMLTGIKNYFGTHYPNLLMHYDVISAPNSPEVIDDYLEKQEVDVLAFNARRRNLFSRLFNPGLAYKMALNSDTALFVTHI
jgi:nucleotide-binding universal stress UspA family protein